MSMIACQLCVKSQTLDMQSLSKKVLKSLKTSFFKGSFYKLCPIDCKLQMDEAKSPGEQYFGILQKT